MNQLPLFKDIMPYGGKLDQNNRWIRLSSLIPWQELSDLHDSYFDPKRLSVVKSARLVVGLMIGKSKLGLSDEEILNYFYENPYFQYFCGFDNFISKESKVMDPSLLTRRRRKLGEKYFLKFESEILAVLKQRNLVKGKDLLLDATVFESKISYPNDVKLLNVVRSYCVEKISVLRNTLKKTLKSDLKIRTYKRTAKKVYLNYAKKKKKSQKIIRSTTRQMLGFTRRNIKQLEFLLEQTKEYLSSKNFKLRCREESNVESNLRQLIKEIENKLITAKAIYQQQKTKYQERTNQIKDRIVSLNQPFIRPILRGKEGNKKVEFGAKAHLASSGGYVFSDKIEHRAFSEKIELENSLERHKSRFNRMPKEAMIDDAYSSIQNKEILKQHNIKHSLKNQGRTTPKQRQEKRKLRKSRSKIEGVIGNLKKDYNLDKIILKSIDGAQIQASLAIGTFNMFRVLREIEV